jgi:hypothetical protein
MKPKYFIIFFLFLGCCNKDDAPVTTIEGKVINAGTKQPIDSVKVIAVDGKSTYDSFFGTSNRTGSGRYEITYTNTKGYFVISIKGNSPCVFLIKDGYEFIVFSEGHGSSDNYKCYFAGKEYNNETLELWARANFNPILKGKNCISTDSICFGDGIIIPGNYLLKNEFRGYGNGPIHPYGGNGLSAFGDFYYHYWMKYQIQGIWHKRIDSVYIKSFTTYTDTIYY